MSKLPNVKLNYDCDTCIHESICMYKRPEAELTNFQKSLIKAVTGKTFDKKDINTSDSPITFVADCGKYRPVLSDEEMAYCEEDTRATTEALAELRKNDLPKEMPWICEYCGVKYEGPLNENGVPIGTCRGCGTEEYAKMVLKPSVKGGDSNE